MVLKTEEQKLDILRNSKNLRWREEGGWKNVFIHADLTLKQREVRRKLVTELKDKKGEWGVRSNNSKWANSEEMVMGACSAGLICLYTNACSLLNK